METFIDYINENLEHFDADLVTEKMWFDYKTRNGKRQKKWHTDRKNYRIQINKKTGQPKEVYITPTERIKRKAGQRKAAIKRRAKQRNITAKRLKSFGVRSKFGMKYDTDGHVIKRKVHKRGAYDPYKENQGLYPNMFEQALNESPHIELLNDYIWDFYAERSNGKPGDWLMQLVSLCKDHRMVSMVPDENNVENGDEIVLSPGEYESVIMTLARDRFFIKIVRCDYYGKLDQEDRELFDMYVDPRITYKVHDPMTDEH